MENADKTTLPADAAATESPNVENKGEEAGAARKSFVDMVFDAVTNQTARGLSLGASTLKVVARWLDGQAKVVGEIATKLSSTSSSSSSREETAKASP